MDALEKKVSELEGRAAEATPTRESMPMEGTTPTDDAMMDMASIQEIGLIENYAAT